jgi:hypothetical protein
MRRTHKNWIGIPIAAIVLISLCSVCVSPLSLAASTGANVQGPALVGATVIPAPAVCARAANSLDLFTKGTNNALLWQHWDGSRWSAATSLGGVLTSSPAVASSGTNRIDVFVRGTDGALWQRTTTNGGATWTAWTSLGGQLPAGTGPGACSWGSGRLDVFVQGTNGALYHKGSGAWSNWENLGGKLTSSPAVASSGTNRIDVFVRGTDGAPYQRSWTGTRWSSWAALDGLIAQGTGPAACSWGSGRLDVFVQGTNGALYHKGSGAWSNWENLGGKLTSSPAAAAASSTSRIDVFVRGTDYSLWQKTYNNGWSGWISLGVLSQTTTQTIYYVPQAGSTWVNRGTAGASYNAYVSTPSLFQTQSNGYSYWGDIARNDFIYIPAGSATNNQNVVSWEIGFHFTGMSGQRYQKIWDKAAGGFSIYIDTLYGASRSYLTIYRKTTGGSHARWYIPTDTVLRASHNYYIQIAWDSSAGPGYEPYPTIWIGEDGNAPVHQTHWDESGARGGTGSWYNDAVGGANLGNMASDVGRNVSAKAFWLDGGFFVYRQYNSIIDFSSGGSWNSDNLRWT